VKTKGRMRMARYRVEIHLQEWPWPRNQSKWDHRGQEFKEREELFSSVLCLDTPYQVNSGTGSWPVSPILRFDSYYSLKCFTVKCYLILMFFLTILGEESVIHIYINSCCLELMSDDCGLLLPLQAFPK